MPPLHRQQPGEQRFPTVWGFDEGKTSVRLKAKRPSRQAYLWTVALSFQIHAPRDGSFECTMRQGPKAHRPAKHGASRHGQAKSCQGE